VDVLLRGLSGLLEALIKAERRIDPYFRDRFDARFQAPLKRLVQGAINVRRPNDGLALAEERLLPGEDRLTAEIIAQLATHLRRTWPPGQAQRAGNTKTYGLVRARFEVTADLPPHLQQGVFSPGRDYPAWVRFAGPGPAAPPDIEDNGILSLGVKLMGVEGPKLIDDERFTQDFTALSAPTFTTSNVIENVKLQTWLARGTPVFYFINPFDSHLLDMLMAALYSRTRANPLEVQYWSTVPFLHGEGLAVQYRLTPRGERHARVPRWPSDNYLREAMARTLAQQEVVFDFQVQVQTDPHRMPIENASVEWPERLSPYRTVAALRILPQRFDWPGQLAFANNLSFNPWHSLPAHRPLGNQNRARRAIYLELSRLRREMNAEPHLEPSGQEQFEPSPG
jgi:hypothetical protein